MEINVYHEVFCPRPNDVKACGTPEIYLPLSHVIVSDPPLVSQILTACTAAILKVHYSEIRARDYSVLSSQCQKWKLQGGCQRQTSLCLLSPSERSNALLNTFRPNDL